MDFRPTFRTEFALYVLITLVNIVFFNEIYEGGDLVQTLRNYTPSDYFIYFCCLLDLVFTFINVIPKYTKFEGAERHKNEMFVKKSYLTSNYVRLFFHILFGILSYTMTAYVWFVNGEISRTFKLIVCAIDVGHEITAWLMLRNHDGAMALRSGNLAFTFLKQIAVAALCHTEDATTIKSLMTFMFTFTSGFAWTRFNCFIIVIISMFGNGSSFDGLREYWYTVGESSAQMILSYVAGVHGECNLALAVAFFYFPHENWVKTEKVFKRRARAVAVGIIAYYLAVPRSFAYTHLIVYHALIVYTYFFCGTFFKRDPLPNVDFTDKKSKAQATETEAKPETAVTTEVATTVETETVTSTETEQVEETTVTKPVVTTPAPALVKASSNRPLLQQLLIKVGSTRTNIELTDEDLCPDFELGFEVDDVDVDFAPAPCSPKHSLDAQPSCDLTERISGAGSEEKVAETEETEKIVFATSDENFVPKSSS